MSRPTTFIFKYILCFSKEFYMLVCVQLEFIHFNFYMVPHCINISTLTSFFSIDGHAGCFQLWYAFFWVHICQTVERIDWGVEFLGTGYIWISTQYGQGDFPISSGQSFLLVTAIVRHLNISQDGGGKALFVHGFIFKDLLSYYFNFVCVCIHTTCVQVPM